ncbi:MAG: protein kinase [Acidobacteriaceae bacterium]
MPLAPGIHLGPYEIQSAIGAGGMGEVYRARDTRLERTVAIKILPAHLSGDAEARQRFDREARAISSLNHANICTLHDVGHQDGVDYLVMEFLEGETLAERIAKGPLSTEQVLRYGTEICEGLERAHRTGVIHRDLKPGNVMLTKSGAKLMDFGLAKSAAAAVSASSLSGVTFAPDKPLTSAGTVVGTFQYMSPEQVEGKEADARSDIFALGAVLYEMATGKRAFEGKTTASVIAAVLERDPEPISTVRPMSPPALDRLVKACVAKDPDDRIQTVHDVKLQLKWIAEGGSQTGVPAIILHKRKNRERFAWALASVLLIAGLAAGYLLRPVPAAPSLRVALNLPPRFRLDPYNPSLALSPNGGRLALAATGPDGLQRLWLRSLSGEGLQPLPGTEGATYPFWSPDARFLGFFANYKLKKIEIATGSVQSLCAAPSGRGAAWGHDGKIIFAPSYASGLYMVAADGGEPSQITQVLKTGESHRLPQFLPDGKHVLFFTASLNGAADAGIYLLDLTSKKVEIIQREHNEARYLQPGYLVFLRGRDLMAERFDVVHLRKGGEAVKLAENVTPNAPRFSGAYTFSDNGLLLFATSPESATNQVTIFNSDGGLVKTLGQPLHFDNVMLSPDGKRVALLAQDPQSGTDSKPDFWILNMATGASARIAAKVSPRLLSLSRSSPVWLPDSRQIAYADADSNLNVQIADSFSPSRHVLTLPKNVPNNTTALSPDGKMLALTEIGASGPDIVIQPLGGDRKPFPFITTAGSENRQGTFSPNGKWFAYTSDESGRFEVYIVPFPAAAGKLQVSSGGGQAPDWIEGGRKLAYINSERKLVAAELKYSGQQVSVSRSREMFGGKPLPALPGPEASFNGNAPNYITPDGKLVVLAVPTDLNSITPLTLVTNWAAGLKK